jgi:hypothetical protein
VGIDQPTATPLRIFHKDADGAARLTAVAGEAPTPLADDRQPAENRIAVPAPVFAHHWALDAGHVEPRGGQRHRLVGAAARGAGIDLLEADHHRVDLLDHRGDALEIAPVVEADGVVDVVGGDADDLLTGSGAAAVAVLAGKCRQGHRRAWQGG